MEADDLMVGHVGYDPECIAMIYELGGGSRAYARERKKAGRRLVSEIHSPPRVTKVLSSMSNRTLEPGLALDLTCQDPLDGEAWDFDKPEKRARARQLLRDQRPLFLIGSPMCRAWSTWQNISQQRRDHDVVRKELIRARVHLRFVMELYKEQMDGGRFFCMSIREPLHPGKSLGSNEYCRALA